MTEKARVRGKERVNRNVRTGRPLTLETPDELEEKVEAYVEKCRVAERPLTMAGMAHYLGFASRQSLYDYEKRAEFSYAVKRARLLIEEQHEAAMFRAGPVAGSIFWLKNHGWSDNRGIDYTGSIVHTLEAMTPEELKRVEAMDDDQVLKLLGDGSD